MRYRQASRERWIRRSAAFRGLVLAVALPGCIAACDVQFNAPKLVLHVHDDRIVFAGAGAAQRLTGGETVLTIENHGSRERQIVLARLGNLTTVPDELLEVETANDDARILDMTRVLAPMGPEERSSAEEPDSSRFHIYLAPGERHVLFDRLGGFEDGVALDFIPGQEATAASTTFWQATAWW